MNVKLKSDFGSLISFLILLIAALIASYFMVAPYLMAIMIGAILALMILPLHRYLRSLTLAPHWAALLATMSMLAVILAPLLIFTAVAVKQAVALSHSVRSLEFKELSEYIQLFSNWGPMSYFAIDSVEVEAQIRQSIAVFWTWISKAIIDTTGNVPAGIIQICLASLTCYYLLLDGPRFFRWVSARIPLDKNIRTIVAETVEATAISVVVASIAAATVQAAIMVLSFLVLNVPGAFLAGGMTFILAWVPIFGSTPVWLFGAGYLYANGHISSAVMMIIAGLITGTIDNFVRPMILKGRGEMNPLISLVAIFGGLQMFGLFGVFIGPIMLAVVVSLLQIWPRVAKSFGLRFDEDE